MTTSYSIDDYVRDLRAITASTDDEDTILARVSPLAQRLYHDRSWFRESYYGTDAEQGFGVHLVHEEPDHSLAILALAWLPDRGTPPHDHGTWAVVVGIEGDERNTRYNRVDDGTDEAHAELEVKHEFIAHPGELVCMKTGGIHKVWNESDQVSVSLHTYGRHVNHTNRSQFDLENNRRKAFVVNVS